MNHEFADLELILNLTCSSTGDLPRGPVFPTALHRCCHRQSPTGEREHIICLNGVGNHDIALADTASCVHRSTAEVLTGSQICPGIA